MSYLRPSAVVGFNGAVKHGLLPCRDGEQWVRASGSTIIVGGLSKAGSGSPSFLQGHTNSVTCLALSKSGRLLASGQVTTISGLARIIIWDLSSGKELRHMEMHQGKVQDLDFSVDDSRLASIGGEDDSCLAIWDVSTGKALSGSPAANDFLYAVRFFNTTSEGLATAGKFNLTIWGFDSAGKLVPHTVQTGQLRRIFTSIAIDDTDAYMYCATSSGDVVQVDAQKAVLKANSTNGKAIGHSITCLVLAPGGHVILGASDGSVHIMDINPVAARSGSQSASFGLVASKKLDGGAVTSIVGNPAAEALSGAASWAFLCGTAACDIHEVAYNPKTKSLSSQVLRTAHAGRVAGVAFPRDYSEVFATCGKDGVRVWQTATRKQLVKIRVENLDCTSIIFSNDGKSIITGWGDGKIRAFGPESGRQLWTIHDAHHGAVAALAGTYDSARIISGGLSDNDVRVWDARSQSLLASMTEHQGGVNCINVRDGPGVTRPECVSAGADGSCIVWDLATFRRRTTLLANTSFKAVVYHPDGSQLVTVGTDRQISYWDAFNGQALRILQGGSDLLNWLAVDSKGKHLVSGDHSVRVWHYDNGNCIAAGSGHGAGICAIAISPDSRQAVSVDAAGAVMVWDLPS